MQCLGFAATPAVSEVAILLDALLTDATAPVPGGLRYAIARALLDVDAPPFDSLEDFSDAIARFEHGEAPAVVRVVALRAAMV